MSTAGPREWTPQRVRPGPAAKLRTRSAENLRVTCAAGPQISAPAHGGAGEAACRALLTVAGAWGGAVCVGGGQLLELVDTDPDWQAAPPSPCLDCQAAPPTPLP